MERIISLEKVEDLSSEFFSSEINNYVGNFHDVSAIVKSKKYCDENGMFEISQMMVLFRSGEMKKFPEPVVKLPIPRWVDAKGYDVSWPISAWRYDSQAKEEVRVFLRQLSSAYRKNDLGVSGVITRDDLRMWNFSTELSSIIGDFNQVEVITNKGLIQKDGKFRHFLEPIIDLPIPEWINATGFEPGAEVQSICMTRSQAEKESEQFVNKLNNFLGF